MTKRKSKAQKLSPQELQAQGKAELRRLRKLSKPKVLAQLKAMDPIVFEYLTAAIFRRSGYKTELTVTSGDEGVDVLATKNFRKVVIQCKRYDGSVGQPTIRDLYGTMLHNKASEAYLVTTATVTRQAQNWAKGKPIQLIDGYKLVEWIVEPEPVASRRWLWVGLVSVMVVGLGLLWQFWPALTPTTEPEPTATITAPAGGPTNTPVPTAEPGSSDVSEDELEEDLPVLE